MASRSQPPGDDPQAAMIGPTTTFYDGDEGVQHNQDAQAQRYQQWMQSYDYGQQHHHHQHQHQHHQQPVQQPPAQPTTYYSTEPYQPSHEYSNYYAGSSFQQHQQQHPAPTYTPPAKPQQKTTPNKRKRAPARDSESDGSDDDIGISVGGVSGARVSRLPGACTHCKKLKMKCDFPPGDNTCKRCKTGGHVCIVEGRKPRTAPNKREYLLAQIRQKDAIIESLLKQLHNPYLATPLSIASYRMATSPSDASNRNVLAWLDRLKSSVQTASGGTSSFNDVRGGEEESDEDEGGGRVTHAQRYGLVPHDEEEEEQEETQTALPDSHVPLGLIANLSLTSHQGTKKGKGKKGDDADDDNVGVANETYFMPGPATNLDIRATLIEEHSPPEILVHGLVAPEDVERLFEIFYKHVNPFVSLLDPILHTPQSTFARCPFLFTVICAISSRYHPPKSSIYPIAMHFAKHSAANALIDGWKSVELCQAYILMSIYAVPARRWEEDRSWLYTGLAIRIATDLNLHQLPTTKPTNEKQEREILNRIRVWQICFNLDRSTATQFGKPSTIKEDSIIRHSADWYKKSPYNLEYDVHMCGYTVLLRIVAKFHDEVFAEGSGLSSLKRVDFRDVTLRYDRELEAFKEEWEGRFNAVGGDRGAEFRCKLLPFLVGYSRLVMFSFGFQQAFHRGIQAGDDLFFNKCLSSAKTVIRCMNEELAPSGFMRYAPDGHFIFAAFASAFLLKLLRPEFSALLSKPDEDEIFDLIGTLIQKLSSSSIAIDDRHTPKLYARFLATLLGKYRRDGQGATVGRLQTIPPSSMGGPGSGGGGMGGGGGEYQQFSVAQEQSGYHPASYQPTQQQQPQTPIYRPEATYAAGAGPIQFGNDLEYYSFEYGNGAVNGNGVVGSPGAADVDMLASIQALKNPEWWQGMLMPGFTWPQANSPGSGGSASSTPPATYSHVHHQNTYGAYQPQQVMVPMH